MLQASLPPGGDIRPLTDILSSGLSQSLESVLGGPRPRANTVGMIRVDQQGRLMPPAMAAQSVVMQQDPRRFSEASIAPPPRPPLPNLKRLNIKAQRKPVVLPAQAPGPSWPSHVVLSPPAQTQQPPQSFGGSNLARMANMARSTPQLDECADNRGGDRERERVRDRERSPHIQNPRDALIAQVGDTFLVAVLVAFSA